MFVLVKANFNIKSISIYLSVLGLVMLILLSPCRVRNFVQAELGVPQTDVLNKSQANLNSAQCNAELNIDQIINTAKLEIKLPPTSAVNFSQIEIPESNDFSGFNAIYLTGSEPLLYVPYYILYQNFKNYL